MTSSRTILFAGGGSGGHLTPGIAVAEELLERDARCRIVFVGSDRPIEKTVLAGTGFCREGLPVRSPGTFVRNPIQFSVGLATSLRQSFRLLDDLQPDVVVGLGGFVSLPLAITAKQRRVNLVLIEQNVVPGRATSWLSRSADRVCLSFDETRRHLPRGVSAIVTGNPVRRAVRSARTCAAAGTDIMILGGSQGAAGVNFAASSAVVALKHLLGGRVIVHQTGARDVEAVRGLYRRAGVVAEVAAYFPDLATRYRSTSLVISRAGATTLAELACFGCPAVLMPYPGAVRNHQQRNAEHYESAGGAIVVSEGRDAVSRLTEVFSELLGHSARLLEMSQAMRRRAVPDAASAVADLLMPATASRIAA